MLHHNTRAFSAAIAIMLLWLAPFLQPAQAQSTRISDHNAIGWHTATMAARLSNRWSLHTEYQWRREDFVTNWQQSLLRIGATYHLNAQVSLQAGYAWIETFNYGDIPINGMGKQFPEHRLYQQVLISQKIGRVDLSHRYRLEQRWLGRYDKPESTSPDGWSYLNRMRYMVRAQIPLQGPVLEDKSFYAAAFDEIFIGFGKQVGENIFDQNRLGLLIGYRFNQAIRLEGGYFQQILMLGREVNGRNVVQYNQGYILNTLVQLDWQRKSPKGSQ